MNFSDSSKDSSDSSEASLDGHLIRQNAGKMVGLNTNGKNGSINMNISPNYSLTSPMLTNKSLFSPAPSNSFASVNISKTT